MTYARTRTQSGSTLDQKKASRICRDIAAVMMDKYKLNLRQCRVVINCMILSIDLALAALNLKEREQGC